MNQRLRLRSFVRLSDLPPVAPMRDSGTMPRLAGRSATKTLRESEIHQRIYSPNMRHPHASLMQHGHQKCAGQRRQIFRPKRFRQRVTFPQRRLRGGRSAISAPRRAAVRSFVGIELVAVKVNVQRDRHDENPGEETDAPPPGYELLVRQGRSYYGTGQIPQGSADAAGKLCAK